MRSPMDIGRRTCVPTLIYKNSALYTHATEKPGTLDGNETYNINIVDCNV